MRKFLLLSLFFCLLAPIVQSQTLIAQSREIAKAMEVIDRKGEVFFRFQSVSPDLMGEIARAVTIDEGSRVGGAWVYAYANRKQMKEFLLLNVGFEVQPHPASLLNPSDMWVPGQNRNLQVWDFYPTYDAYLAMMTQFQATYPNLCKIIQIGTSTNGRKLLIAKISDNVNTEEAEPRFLYTSSIHGDELTGFILMLRLIDHLLTNYGTNADLTSLVNNMEIWISPSTNPDGTYAGGNSTVAGATRYNANGVDLNRNFLDFIGGAHPDGEAYQQETLEMMALADSVRFVMGANFHGGAEVANYPWDAQYALHPDDNWFQVVSHRYADTCQAFGPAGYMDDLVDGTTNGAAWYIITGGRQDLMNYYHQCREITLEISITKTPAASTLPTFWNSSYRSLINMIREANYGFRGTITDSITGEPLVGKVFIENHDQTNSWVFSKLPFGDYYRPVYPGTYTVTYSAEGYEPKTIAGVVAPSNNFVVQDAQLTRKAFEASPLNTCIGLVEFSSLLPPAGLSFIWHFGDGTTSTQTNPSHTYQQNGQFTVTLQVISGTDTTEFVKTNYITVNLPPAPASTDLTICQGQTAQLVAVGGGAIRWFNTPTDGTPFLENDTLTTATLTQTDTFYVESLYEAPLLSAGKPDNTGGGGYFTQSSIHYLVFDCLAPLKLISVKVYAQTAGQRVITLQDSLGTPLQSVTVTIPAGEQVVPLNIDLPVANNLRLAGPSAPNLYRNNGGTAFPYTVAGNISIKSTSAQTNPTNYYYYFYDWKVKGNDCKSARVPVRVEVVPGPPSVDFSFTQTDNQVSFTNLSSGADSYIWDFGDGFTSTDPNPVHSYSAIGSFTVTLTAENICGPAQDTDTLQNLVTISPAIHALNGIDLYPNPATGNVAIRFLRPMDGPIGLTLKNVMGQVVWQTTLPPTNQETHLDLSTFHPGIYSLSVNTGKTSFCKNLVIQ